MNYWIYEDNVLTTPSGLRWQARSGGIWPKDESGKNPLPVPDDKYRNKSVPNGWRVSEPIPTGWYDILRLPGKSPKAVEDRSLLPANLPNRNRATQNLNRLFRTSRNCPNPRMWDSASRSGWFCPIEPRVPNGRTVLGIHPDGSDPSELPKNLNLPDGVPDGSHGCIAILNPDTSLLLEELISSKNRLLEVRNVKRWWEEELDDPFRKWPDGPVMP